MVAILASRRGDKTWHSVTTAGDGRSQAALLGQGNVQWSEGSCSGPLGRVKSSPCGWAHYCFGRSGKLLRRAVLEEGFKSSLIHTHKCSVA